MSTKNIGLGQLVVVSSDRKQLTKEYRNQYYPIVSDDIPKKLLIPHFQKFVEHRSGWNFVMQQLLMLRKNNKNANDGGILVDDFIESTFSWHYVDRKNENMIKDVWFGGRNHRLQLSKLVVKDGKHVIALDDGQLVEYDTNAQHWVLSNISREDYDTALQTSVNTVHRQPWIGFWHNPYGCPFWYDYDHSPQSILQRPEFQQSLKSCKGIFVFSEYLAKWLRNNLPKNVKVNVVYHPTEAGKEFSWLAFKQNNDKRVVQVGYWLRSLHGIYQLQVDSKQYKKMWLYGNAHAFELMKQEHDRLYPDMQYIDPTNCSDVQLARLSNEDYDELLSKNIVFLKLFDSSCNNAIIECIARATPVLVNRIEPVEEYLGKNYPLYYETLEQASLMLQNMQLLERAHQYLLTCPMRSKLTAKAFLDSFVQSEIYQSL